MSQALDLLPPQPTVIPVLTIERVEDAVPLARALVRGGLRVLEVTLRTEAGAAAAAAIRREVPDAIVALGTILSDRDVDVSRALGIGLGFSPGATPALLSTARAAGLALIPGVQTASELMTAMAFGFCAVKFFPAAPAGGPAMLKAFGGPFPSARFCPTGGISEETASSWFSLPNVFALGGSWIATARDIDAHGWTEITAKAAAARAIAERL